jgi:hypothetical protein
MGKALCIARPPYRPTPVIAAETLFQIVNPSTLPGWVLLLFAPRWRGTLPIVRVGIIPLLAVVYVAILVTTWGEGQGDFQSLAGVMALFDAPYGVVAGWVHFLAFDLFVGAWIVEDALKRGLPAWARVVPLPLTFMLGPAGLGLYLLLRAGHASPRPAA